MKLRTWLEQGRGQLLALVLAVVVACCFGCGGDDEDGGSGNNPGNNGGNNGGGNADYVTLGGKKWMKKNLNVQTENSWCYDNSPDSCAKYGRLYTWEAAKSACPVGWHLPSDAEWDALVTFAGGSSVAGKKLKLTSGWYSNGNGTDEFGFSALPGGYRRSDGDFYGAGDYGRWWTATEYDANDAYYRRMYYFNDNVYSDDDYKNYAWSVRCVGD
jgi:uncharacterized protein (TIGR02145 family)